MKDEKLENNSEASLPGITKDKIAVIGVSLEPDKYGHKIFVDLLRAGYNVIGINPKGGVVMECNLFTSLDQVKPVPDLVITVVPPQITEAVVVECKNIGIKKVWMQSGSESEAAINLAREAGIEVITNACFMVDRKLW